MLLYEHPGSPYAQKIKIALREKGVAFDVEIPDSMATGRTDGAIAYAAPHRTMLFRNECTNLFVAASPSGRTSGGAAAKGRDNGT